MADNSASTPVAAVPTNTPDTATQSPGAAGAAASAVTANAHPVVTGIVSRRGANAPARSVIAMKTDNAKPKVEPAKEAAPATDPKAGDGKESGQEASSSSKAAPSSSEGTGETPKDTKADTGKNADAKAKSDKDGDEPDPNSRRGKSWAELQEREAELVKQRKELADERKQIAAELAERKEVNELIKAGKLMAAARKLGITLKALNEEYLKGVDEDPDERAARIAADKVKELKEAELAETKRLADEEVKKHTEKATREITALYGAMEEELEKGAAEYPAIGAFKLSKEQTLQIAHAELGRIPTAEEGKATLAAVQAFFHKRILEAGYVKKTDVPAPAPAATATDTSPRTLTNGRNEVPLVPRAPGKRLSTEERLAEAMAKYIPQ